MLDATVGSSGDLDAVDPDALSDDELTACVMRVQEQRGAFEANEARLLDAWDRRKVWRADGAKTGAAWLAAREHLPMAEARRRLRHAREMRRFPAIAEAWARGEIDRCHLTTLLGACTTRTEAAFEAEHDQLVDAARSSRFADFKRQIDIWTFFRDPDGAEQSAADQEDAREAHFSESFQGMWFGRMTFDPVNGTIINVTWQAIEDELFQSDWAEAKERLGRTPLICELRRTPSQRRADALVEMAIRARTAPKDGRRPAPLFTVVCGLDTLTGPILELWNRTVITPATAACWLTDADIERIVFDAPSRVVDVGATRRFFTGALRRAIEVRDRTCFHPLCDEPPRWPQIDHIDEAGKGGPTTQANGRLACGHHNRLRNTHPDAQGVAPDVGDPDAGPDPPEDG